MASISGSVGRGGRNVRRDVRIVQALLNNQIHRMVPLAPVEEDGSVGKLTVGAIEMFQRRVVEMVRPDSRVDPNGETFRRLGGGTPRTTRRLPSVSSLLKHYPTVDMPCDQGWKNQCAVRLSIALIGAGFRLDGYTEPTCRHGHARGAESLATFLWHNVGRPEIGRGIAARNAIFNRSGVIFFRNIRGFRGGQGDHIDLWTDNGTLTGAYFHDAQEVWFWPAS